MEQSVGVAHVELKIPGTPPSPHGLPPCVLDAFCCLDNMSSRIVEDNVFLPFGITLLGLQISWGVRLYCSFYMLLPPPLSPTPPAYHLHSYFSFAFIDP